MKKYARIAAVFCVVTGGVLLWHQSRLLLTLKGHTRTVYDVAFSPDGKRVASVGGDFRVMVRDTTTGQTLLSILGSCRSDGRVAFSPDGKNLASIHWSSNSLPMVKVWDASTGEEKLVLKGHTRDVTSLAFSPDGKLLATGSMDQTVKVWDATTGLEVFTVNVQPDLLSNVAFSADGKWLAAGTGNYGQPGKIKLWDAKNGEEMLSLIGHVGVSQSIEFSRDGKRLASVRGSHTPAMPVEVKIWDVPNLQQKPFTWEGPIAGNPRVALSPDGKQLALVCGERRVELRDATDGRVLMNLNDRRSSITGITSWLHKPGLGTLALALGGIQCLAFSPDGKRLATADINGTVNVWDVTP